MRVHRETGNKVLWANFTMRPILLGLPEAESKELLTIVLNQYRKPAYQVRFKWAPGSVAFWDNRAAVHYAVKNYGDYPRSARARADRRRAALGRALETLDFRVTMVASTPAQADAAVVRIPHRRQPIARTTT